MKSLKPQEPLSQLLGAHSVEFCDQAVQVFWKLPGTREESTSHILQSGGSPTDAAIILSEE